jgi:signal transduction histidine kinase
VTLDIHDDGVGFEPTRLEPRQAGGSGFGLTSLRERVERLNGTLDIESTPGGGTTIAIALPTTAGVAPEQPALAGGSY